MPFHNPDFIVFNTFRVKKFDLQLKESIRDQFLEELERAFFYSNYQVQARLSALDVLELEQALLRLQARGVLLDLLVFGVEEAKSIQLANMLLRFASGGGLVFFAKEQTKVERFAILDKMQVRTTRVQTEDVAEKIANFHWACMQATPIIPGSGAIQIVFTAESEVVKLGQRVVFNWEVQGADHIRFEPEGMYLPYKGSMEQAVRKDTVFRIRAWNQDGEAQRALFIRCATGPVVRIEVSQLEPPIGEYILLESPAGFPGTYAVARNTWLRIRWDAGPTGTLEEKNWGILPSRGERALQTQTDDITLHFFYKTIRGSIIATVQLVVESTREKPIEEGKQTRRWFRQK